MSMCSFCGAQVLLTPNEEWQTITADAAAGTTSDNEDGAGPSSQLPASLGVQAVVEDGEQWGLVCVALLSLVKLLAKRVAGLQPSSKPGGTAGRQRGSTGTPHRQRGSTGGEAQRELRRAQSECLRSREAALVKRLEAAVKQLLMEQLEAEGESGDKPCLSLAHWMHVKLGAANSGAETSECFSRCLRVS